MSDAWQLHDGGQQYGPFSKSEIATMIAEGRVSAATAQVWQEGMAGWVPVATVVPPQPVQKIPAQPGKIHRSKKRPLITAYVVGGIAVVLVVGLVWAFTSRGTISVLGGSREPGFRVTSRSLSVAYKWCEVTNELPEKLEITKVTLNGEFVCAVGEKIGYGDANDFCVFSKTKDYPVTLAIGEFGVFVQYCDLPGTEKSPKYRKRVIFVDIDTNRGRFRYQDDVLKSVD